MTTPSGYTRLEDFEEKTNPVADDIIYMADSENDFEEIKVSYQNLQKNISLATLSKYFSLGDTISVLGEASQSGTTITGVGTMFTNIGTHGLVVFDSGEYAVITGVISDTVAIADRSQTVAQTSITIHYDGAQFDVNGNGAFNNIKAAINYPIQNKTSTFTVEDNSTVYVIDATSGSVTVNLIAANKIKGKLYIFKKTNATNSVVITANGSDLIDGSATNTLTSQYSSVQIISNGSSAWHVIG